MIDTRRLLMALALAAGAVAVSAADQPKLPPAQLGIAPPRLEIDLEGPRANESFKVINLGSEPKVIELSLSDRSHLPGGGALAPSPETLSHWTLFNPKRFELAPGAEQVVRMSIRPARRLRPGTHRAVLQVVQQNGGGAERSSDGKRVTLRIGSSYGMPIVVNVR